MPRRPPENTLATRAEFFARGQDSWTALADTWATLSHDAFLVPGACGETWSVKDLINHIAAWQEAAIRVIGDLLGGRWGRLGANTDKFNAQQYALDRDRPLAESRERLAQARRILLELLATVPADRLLDEYGRQQIGWWAKWTTYAHYEEHIADLRAFRERVSMLPENSQES